MTKEKKGSTITNQVTPKQVEEMVAEIDAEVPENLQEIMDKEKDEQVVVEDDVEEEVAVEEEVTPEPEVEEVVEETVTPKTEVAPVLPPVETRYKEAGQEAMILNNRNEKILETIDEADKPTEVTIDELRTHALSLGETYDNLDTFSQNLVKDSLLSKKYREKLSTLVADDKNTKVWVKKVTDFISDDKIVEEYPALKGHEEDFLKYASKKTHMNADMDLLIAGFLFRLPKDDKPSVDVLLPRGGGSKNMPIPPKVATQDDAKIDRKKDMKKFMENAQKGKYKVDL